jgi:hypothetical protein
MTKRAQTTQAVIRLLLLGTALLLLQGCLSGNPRRLKVLRVSISPAGLVQAGGEVTMFPGMVDLLRSLGATPATRIEVELPEQARANLMLRATQMLRDAGYGKTVFITAERKEAFATEQRVSSRRKAQIKRGER